MPTILIVDPDPHIRLLLDYNLRSAGFATLTAATGAEALSCAAQADLVITEMMLPDTTRLDLLRSCRLPTIIISNDPSKETLIKCLDAGADDYITKPFSVRELISRVRGILRSRARARANSLVRVGTLQIDTEKYEVHLSGQELSLTHREFQILLVLAQPQGAVCTREEILSQV